MAQQDTALKHTTTCRLCGKQAQEWQMDVPVIGKTTAERVEQFVGETLAGHLQRKHGDRLAAIKTGGSEFMGMLIMMLFSTSDPILNAAIERVRGQIAQLCKEETAQPATPTG